MCTYFLIAIVTEGLQLFILFYHESSFTPSIWWFTLQYSSWPPLFWHFLAWLYRVMVLCFPLLIYIFFVIELSTFIRFHIFWVLIMSFMVICRHLLIKSNSLKIEIVVASLVTFCCYYPAIFLKHLPQTAIPFNFAGQLQK